MIDTIDDDVDVETVPIKERLRGKELLSVIMNFESDGTEKYGEMVNSLYWKRFLHLCLKEAGS